MMKISESLYNIRLLDDFARRDSSVHGLHPLVKLLATVVYLIVTVSFDRYDIIGLLPMILFPVLLFTTAELPVAPIMKRVLMVEPLIIGIGILNPLFDRQMAVIGGISISGGWITFMSIFIKSGLTVTASILLIATTGIDRLGAAMRMLKIPKLFVLQLLLTFRYISVLAEELFRMQRAYSLRAPEQKGVHHSIWGSFAGQLFLRTYDRAQRVYQSMSLRGFKGEYNIGKIRKPGIRDFVWLAAWSLYFVTARIYDIPVFLGNLLTGVFK